MKQTDRQQLFNILQQRAATVHGSQNLLTRRPLPFRPSSRLQVDPLVALQIAFLCEALAAGQAAVRPLAGVHPAVGLEVAQLGEAAAAQGAAERPLAGVGQQVGLQVAGVREEPSTLAAAQQVPGSNMGVRVLILARQFGVTLRSDTHPLAATPPATGVTPLGRKQSRRGSFGCGGSSAQ